MIISHSPHIVRGTVEQARTTRHVTAGQQFAPKRDVQKRYARKQLMRKRNRLYHSVIMLQKKNNRTKMLVLLKKNQLKPNRLFKQEPSHH